MSDKRIWAEGHKEASLELCEDVIRDIKDDIIAVIAAKFEDDVTEKVVQALGEYYKFDTDVVLVDAKQAEYDKQYVPADDRTIAPGKVYRHFKGNYYKVLHLALETESNKTMVIYTGLNPTLDEVFCRPLLNFISEVDRGKYPECKQRWRFECVRCEACQ